MAKKQTPLTVEAFKHEEARRKNIPNAEFQSVMDKDEQSPIRLAYGRGAAGLEKEKGERNRDLDPQLVWRGKDEQDWSALVLHALPLYIQENIHPKVLIDDLLRLSEKTRTQNPDFRIDLFADFNGPVACSFNYDAHSSEFNKLGRIAVKAINHLGDEVMKVFRVN